MRLGVVIVAAFACNKAYVVQQYCQRFSATSLAAKTNNDDEWSRRDFLSASSMAAALLQMNVLLGGSAEADAAAETTTLQLTLPATIPFSTRRSYRHILLPNGLRVLLVNDKKVIRASAALCISGAGQFQEDPETGGLAHLLEHMVSSAAPKEDFEDWLEERDGASNAFTAPDRVCYHFNVPPESFSDSLLRFSELFLQDAVVKACRDDAILKREIRRVDSELDFHSDFNRAFYLVKSLVNKDHPFSRFTQGSIDSLERIPAKRGISVATKLIKFFKKRYLPSEAALVVICPCELDSLERWVAPFASSLSQVEPEPSSVPIANYPAPLAYSMKPKQYVLWHPKGDSPLTENIEKLSLQWLLERTYGKSGPVLTSTTVGFFISQLIDRRGPGSLYKYLLRRAWIPEGNQGLPRITFPIDVSGFQLMKLDIVLTIEGFLNRSAVVVAVYDCLKAVLKTTGGSFNVPDDILKQYVTIARLYGYNIAPRPPDAVELAFDAGTYGMGAPSGVGTEGVWPLVPSLEDPNILSDLRKAVADILRVIIDPKYAIIILTVSNKSISQSRNSFVDTPIPPPLMSDRWQVEPISGARYLTDESMSIYGYIEEWITNKFEDDEIQSPSYNPLIPSKLRPPRPIREQIFPDGSTKLYYIESEKDSVWREFVTKPTQSKEKSWEDRALEQDIGPEWKLYQTTGGALPLPMMPEEPTCRSAIVIQLLSTRPARATVDEAAFAQLWMLSFGDTIQDLAELGAPAGLAYDLSFNKFGLRICFLGISQNISSYTRRFCRRLCNHHSRLMLMAELKPSLVERTILDASRRPGLTPLRKRQIVEVIRKASAQEVAREGKTFLASSSGALCLVQGDILPKEAVALVGDIKSLFDAVKVQPEEVTALPAVPDLSEILYKPFWKPRSASLCSIPGAQLISDPCGRIPR